MRGLSGSFWATDELNGSLSSLDWPALRLELEEKTPTWTDMIASHAKAEDAYFPTPSTTPPEENDPESA